MTSARGTARRPHFTRAQLRTGDAQPLSTWDKLAGPGREFCQAVADAQPPKGSAGLVWPTIVLGSECLRVGGAEDQQRTRLHSVVHTLDVRLRRLAEQDRVDSLRFVRQMLRERLGVTLVVGGLGARGADPATRLYFTTWRLRLIVAAAVANRLYFSERARNFGAVARSSGSIVDVDADEEAWQKPREALEALHGDAASPNAVIELSASMTKQIGLGSVRLGDLQSLTELAWNELMGALSDYGGYPDWQDFLNQLKTHQGPATNLRDSSESVRQALQKANDLSLRSWESPGPNIEDSPRMGLYSNVAKLLHDQTGIRRRVVAEEEEAQEARRLAFRERQGAGRPGELRGIAADPRPEFTGSRGLPPPAAVYVTTFDLELELALLALREEEDGAVVIVAPIHIIDRLDTDPQATWLWMARVVRRHRGESPVKVVKHIQTTATSDGWFLLSTVEEVGNGLLDDADNNDHARTQVELLRAAVQEEHGATPQQCVRALYQLPFIVHLMGAPLLRPPTLLENPDRSIDPTPLGKVALGAAGLQEAFTQRRKEIVDARRKGDHLDGNLAYASCMTLLSEADAIRASLPEVIPGDSQSRRPPKNLPGALWHGFSDQYWRYWILLGVELNDPVVRYRILAQLLGDGLTRPQVESERWSSRSGLTVNLRPLSDRTYQALRWCGFQSIAPNGSLGEPPNSLTQAPGRLAHLLQHLGAAGVSTPIDRDACALHDGGYPW